MEVKACGHVTDDLHQQLDAIAGQLHASLCQVYLQQAIPPIPTHFSMVWSVVCHTRAPCLNHSTDLDAIWQIHLWGPLTHCVSWSFLPQGKGRFGGRTPSQNMQLQIAAKPSVLCCHLANTNK